VTTLRSPVQLRSCSAPSTAWRGRCESADDYVTADGQRFLVNTVVDQPTHPALTVILNWAADLNK